MQPFLLLRSRLSQKRGGWAGLAPEHHPEHIPTPAFSPQLSREFSQLAHLTAVLLALCNDPVPYIRSFAVQGVSCLYGVLLHQKGKGWLAQGARLPQQS